MIIATGFISVINMVREAFPAFSLDMIRIYFSCPGADPKDIYKDLSLKAKEAVEKIEGIDSYSAFSRERLFLASIEVNQGYNGSEIFDDACTKVNSISTFPLSAEKPVVRELMLQDPVTMMYIPGGTSERALKKLLLQIKYEVRKLPAIFKLKVFGNDAVEVNDDSKLAMYLIVYKTKKEDSLAIFDAVKT